MWPQTEVVSLTELYVDVEICLKNSLGEIKEWIPGFLASAFMIQNKEQITQEHLLCLFPLQAFVLLCFSKEIQSNIELCFSYPLSWQCGLVGFPQMSYVVLLLLLFLLTSLDLFKSCYEVLLTSLRRARYISFPLLTHLLRVLHSIFVTVVTGQLALPSSNLSPLNRDSNRSSYTPLSFCSRSLEELIIRSTD